MKTWKPDTCGCVVEELYEQGSIIGMGEVLKKCEAHAEVLDEELYDVILNKENRVKNGVYRALLGLESVKGLGLEKANENGTIELKDGVEFTWSFSGTGKNRVLNAEVKGATLTKNQKDALKAHADQTFGEGKVSLTNG